MIAVSGALIFGGYTLAVYGWSQLQGQNAGFFDLLWPGRYKGNTPDSGGATPMPVTTNTAAPVTTVPAGVIPPTPIGK